MIIKKKSASTVCPCSDRRYASKLIGYEI